MEHFDELRARIEALTGLNSRAAGAVAASLLAGMHESDDSVLSAGDIVREAEQLGYEIKRPEGADPAPEPAEPKPAAEVSMNPAEVLSEVYMVMPRVLCTHMPKLGKAPNEAHELGFSELIEQLPEDVQAMLVKIDLYEGQATFWLRDEANEIDRPIGPIDITRYEDGTALQDAFDVLMRRLPLVLAADFN